MRIQSSEKKTKPGCERGVRSGRVSDKYPGSSVTKPVISKGRRN